ncbi:MAG: response regulator, partial [Magnetococcales bacterium]|nr:response regulator [Magnetococcales bacterium]
HLALQTSLDTQQRHYLSRIEEAGRTLLHIINDILDFSKIEAGKLTLEQVPFAMDKVADRVAAMVAPKTQDRSLELIVFVDHQLPPLLLGDSLRLGQVLLNLLSNAVKFTEAGEVCLEILLVERAATEVTVGFKVRDTGIGMTPEQMSRLFTAFTQADSTTTRRYGGTGLGLAICRHLVERMGGEILLVSGEGRGIQFSFQLRFPIAGEHDTLPAAQETPIRLTASRLLVVDDHPMARRVCREMLAPYPCRIEEAENGLQAVDRILRAATGDPFDLVLMDWRMPGMDGLEAMRRVRDALREHAPPMILVTAFGQDEVSSSASREEVPWFLMKPYTTSALLEMIAQAQGGGAHSAVPDPNARPLIGGLLLLVEDNELNQEVARGMRGMVGCRVEVAVNGVEAVEKVSTGRYDLVLMDVQMPIMDGFEATRRIRSDSRWQHLPIIAMTANAMSGDRDLCLQAGMNDYVSKPIEPPLLYASLIRWMPPGVEKPSGAKLTQTAETISAPPREEKGAVSTGMGLSAEMVSGGEGAAFPQMSGIDTRFGLATMGGDEELYRTILVRFVQSQQDAGRMMATQWAQRDRSTLERTAHTLKGVGASIGAQALSAAAAAVERAAHPEVVAWDVLPPLIDRVIEALEVVVTSIAQAFPRAAVAIESRSGEPMDPAVMIPLFRRAAALMFNFDSEAEVVIEEIQGRIRNIGEAERLEGVKTLLAGYDYEGALEALRQWSREAGIEWEES